MLPEAICSILSTLSNAGEEAYVVGGCVRDMLLDRSINDWDITTSAKPEKVESLFEKTVPTGIAHGTVTVLESQTKAEVTTFRTDGEYKDHRHPEQVQFVASLEEDLSRRDFTVNAMAMDQQGLIVDLFGGREDLERKLIRCVGDAVTRFTEDALRMFRAYRFCAQLGFSLDPQIERAVQSCRTLSEKLSVERIRDEVEKILLSSKPETVHLLAENGLLSRFGVHAANRSVDLTELPCERLVRWSALFVLYPQLSNNVLRLDKYSQRLAAQTAELWPTPYTRAGCKRIIAEYGSDVAACYAKGKGHFTDYEAILASGECVQLSQLAVSGNDLPGSGPLIGKTLHQMLLHVLEHPENNRKEFLLSRQWEI